MVPYLLKAFSRDSSLVSKLSPPMNNLPSSDILSVALKRENSLLNRYFGAVIGHPSPENMRRMALQQK